MHYCSIISSTMRYIMRQYRKNSKKRCVSRSDQLERLTSNRSNWGAKIHYGHEFNRSLALLKCKCALDNHSLFDTTGKFRHKLRNKNKKLTFCFCTRPGHVPNLTPNPNDVTSYVGSNAKEIEKR